MNLPQKIQMKKIRNKINGVLLLDKPLGMSSNFAIQRVKRLLNAEKIGHTGTLDPMATGLLPICLGEATKFASYLLDGDKEYIATAQLGVVTDSGDSEGNIVANNAVDTTLELIHAAIAKFSGEITQVPPMYSALKFNGRPLYEYARAGINIERPARNVTIHNIELVSYDEQLQQICFIAKVSKGTYIRTLAEDIGNELGCGASLIALRRTQSNQFMIADTVQVSELENIANWQDVKLLPIDILCEDLTKYEINQATFIGIQNGNPALLGSVDEVLINKTVRIYYCSRFLGIAEINLIDNQAWLSPKRLLQNIAGII